MKLALPLSLLCATALAQTTTNAKPPNLEDVMAARNYAMAGAYRSLGYGAETINGNPAALTLFKRYQVELSGAYDFKNTWGYGGVSVADSISSEVAGGASYQMVSLGNDAAGTRRTVFMTTVASAYSPVGFLHLGVAVKHQLITGYNEANSVTMNAGVIFAPFEELTLSFSAQNIIGVWNTDVPRYFSFAASSLLGGQFTPTVELRADFNQAKPRFVFAGGMEWLIANSFPVRVGYSNDQVSGTQHLGFGIGYFNEGSGVDLAYRHEIGGTEGKMLALTIKVQFN